jgi:hypothetical protein
LQIYGVCDLLGRGDALRGVVGGQVIPVVAPKLLTQLLVGLASRWWKK